MLINFGPNRVWRGLIIIQDAYFVSSLLRLKGTLRADSISNNLNPELEGVHVGLLTSVLSHINGRACVVVFLPNDDTIRTVYQCLTNTQSFQTGNYDTMASPDEIYE